jgi:hypothetical protein
VGDGEPERLSAYDELPACEITASQLVAWNLARFRQAAGLQQDELGAKLGWSGKKVSALETSWKGGRPRQFEASVLVALSAALGIPVAAFLLPPEDDGVNCRYVLLGPEGQDDLSMADLAAQVISAPAEDDTKAMAYYRHRYEALAGYLDPSRLHEVSGTFDDYTAEEHITVQLAKLGRLYDGLREALLEFDGQQDGLQRKLERIRGQ